MSSSPKPNQSSPPPSSSAHGAVLDLESAGVPLQENPPPATAKCRCQAFWEVTGTVSGALKQEPISYWFLLSLSAVTMVVSLTVASFLTRAYMESQESTRFSTFFCLASAGWPLTALVLVPLYALNKQAPPSQLFRSAPIKFFAWAVGLGGLNASSNLFIIGMSSFMGDNGELLMWSFHGCSLALTSALFGRFVAKNRFRSSVNLAVVVTIAALIASYKNTKPFVLDESYASGNFIGYLLLDLPSSVIRGLAFAIIERVYFSKLRSTTPWSVDGRVRAFLLVVLEVTLLISFFSFAFSTIALSFTDNGFGHYFQVDSARRFSGGKTAYYAVVLGSIVAYHLAALAGVAVICLASATIAGVLGAVSVTASGLVVAAFFDANTLTGFSVLAFVLAIWGLLVHAYGRCRARQL